MNWGLFLVLVGFLLPTSVAIRMLLDLTSAGLPLRRPVQLGRLVLLFLLLLPVTGKAPAVIYALTGRYGDVGQLQIDFMSTRWGWSHFAATLLAVAGIDLWGPRLAAQLEAAPAVEPDAPSYVVRDAGIVLLCFVLGWMGAR